MVHRLSRYIKPFLGKAILCSIFIILEVILELQIPLLAKNIIDNGILSKDSRYIIINGSYIVFLAILCLLCGMISGRLAAITAMGFGGRLRGEVFEKTLFDTKSMFKEASISNRITVDVGNIQMAFMTALQFFSRSPILVLICWFNAFCINMWLSIIFFIFIPFLSIIFYLISKKAFPLYTSMLQNMDKMNLKVQENIEGIKIVKAFVQSEQEKDKFIYYSNEVYDKSLKAEGMLIRFWPIAQFSVYAGTILLIGFGGIMSMKGYLGIGDLIALISYLTMAMVAMVNLVTMMTGLIMAKASAARIIEILEINSPRKQAKNSDLHITHGDIYFDNILFRYTKTAPAPVLNFIDLSIRAGETVGIVGGTGAGKTTLVSLLMHLFEPDSGKVVVDGYDINTYDIMNLRNEIAIVPQISYLFQGSILENLIFGNVKASNDDIINACKVANIHEFISNLTDGYNTKLEEGGANLSGGQRQRLCIARALILKPKILILDDSTSAVDSRTESNIMKNVRKFLSGSTILVISQRIKAIRNSDKIVLLAEGKVLGTGNHDTLFKNNEIYRELCLTQLEGREKC